MELSLKGYQALVGGATSGIGKAIAIAFAKSGASVTIVARNEEKLKSCMAELDISEGQSHDYIVADYKEPKILRNKINEYVENTVVDILVNNTGGPPAGPILDAETEEFLTAYKMHLFCNHILTKAVVPGMKEKGRGRIINIISTSVRQPIPNIGVSNTTRGAIGNWSKTLANEIGKYNITVNNILPGPIRTPRLISIMEHRAKLEGVSLEEAEEGMSTSVPLGRIGEPEEIASGAVFLASDAGSFVHGTNLIIDGGRTKCY